MDASNALMKAGQIASQVREEAVSLVEVGRPILEICEFVRREIKKRGGEQAFPCNVDINEVAAHYTSPIGDVSVIEEGSIVKIDIGVHVDGYIADTAVSVCLEPRLRGMVEAAQAGLDVAISSVRAGVNTSDIGAVIERTIKSRGYNPIRNLTGHRMARYVVHSGQAIPNVAAPDGHRLNVGDVYAIEPFTVPPDAASVVIDGPVGHIYLFTKKRKVNGETSKRMLKFIQSNYRTMPFASRWVLERFPGGDGVEAFRELQRSRCLYSYPQLVERSRAPVAQAEHTVIVTEEGCLVTTA